MKALQNVNKAVCISRLYLEGLQIICACLRVASIIITVQAVINVLGLAFNILLEMNVSRNALGIIICYQLIT